MTLDLFTWNKTRDQPRNGGHPSRSRRWMAARSFAELVEHLDDARAAKRSNRRS